MAPDRNNAGLRQLKRTGTHRKPRKRRSALARTVAAGGAALCIGAAYDLSTPSADALSILLPGPTVNGVGNATRINIFEGNIFNPQFGGGSVSNNSTVGNVFIGQGNNIVNHLLSQEFRLGGAAGNGNVTQINILSYNIFNPQISLGPNVSNNTSVNNVAMGNGNNSSTEVPTAGGVLPLFGGATGNGNTVQFSFLSGNIFNPQWSLFGENVSNNTAITNVAIGNGNYSATSLALGGLFGTFLFGGGNGNTFQYGFFVSNIYNPQFSWGGGNVSNNTAITNTASGNGNNSTTEATGGGLLGGTTGNGNTNQVSTGSGNINNDQVNIGVNLVGSTSTGAGDQQQGVDLINVSSNSTTTTESDDSTPTDNPSPPDNSLSDNSTPSDSSPSDNSTPSDSSTTDTPSGSPTGGDGGGSAGGGSGGGGDSGGGGGGSGDSGD